MRHCSRSSVQPGSPFRYPSSDDVLRRDFPDETSDEVLGRAPYATRPGRDTTNATDEIFPTGGDPAVLDIVPTADGYRAGICLVLPDSVGRS
jgi:hypothetical protein